MAWARIDESAATHPKVLALSDRAFRVWVNGLCYCQTHLTDGSIPRAALRVVSGTQRTADELVKAGLWIVHPDGYRVHDYLDWNDSRETIEYKRRLGAHRVAFVRDPQLRNSLRARDGDYCRYCGGAVNWADRKGPNGATYDHIDPRGDATLDNLVIACRSCNNSKRNRTPEEAGMCLRQISNPTTDPITDLITHPTSEGKVHSSSVVDREGERERKPRASGRHAGRIFLHRWQLDALIATLGPLAADFGLYEWLDALNQRIAGHVLPPDPWAFVKAELHAEVQRRGLAVAAAGQVTATDWYADCKVQHNGECGSAWRHDQRLHLDAAKAARAEASA